MDTRINQQSFLQCLDELEAESSDNYLELYRQEYERDKQAQIEKAASAITTAAPAMLSSILGYAFGQKKGYNQVIKDHQNMLDSQVQNKDYYKQMQDMQQNLNVSFTPFGVMYSLDYKNRPLPIENIQTEDMDNTMLNHYNNKNEVFFKNLFLNKVNADLQFAEQEFARRLAVKQMQMENNKTASEEDITFADILNESYKAKSMMETEIGEKYASVMFDKVANEVYDVFYKDDYTRLWEGIGKCAMLGEIMDFFGLNASKELLNDMRTKFNDPGYMERNLVIKFLPDRVLFLVNGTVVTQLKLMSMNEQGFEAFQNSNSKYFKKLFAEHLSKPSAGQPTMQMQKKAALEEQVGSNDTKNIFLLPNIHPMLYIEKLNQIFGQDWKETAPEVLIKEIEDTFSLYKAIDDIALNKILMSQILYKNPNIILNNYHIFEKAIRCFNDKPVDFGDSSENNLDSMEIAFGIKTIRDITGVAKLDIDRTVDFYIADALVANDERMFYPPTEIGLLEEDTAEINKICIDLTNQKMSKGVNNDKLYDEIIRQNVYIVQNACAIADKIHSKGVRWVESNINDAVDSIKGLPEYMKEILSDCVIKSLMAVDYIKVKDDLFDSQKEKYN